MTTLSDKVLDAAEKHGVLKSQLDKLDKELAAVLKSMEADDADEDVLMPQIEELTAQVDELRPQVEASQKKVDALKKAEASMAARARPAAEKAPAFTHGYKEPDHIAGDFFMKSALTVALAHINRQPIAQVIEERYGDDDRTKHVLGMMTKTAGAIADTTTSGWASQLVRSDMRGFLEAMSVRSVAAGLAGLGMQLEFNGAGSVVMPKMNDMGLAKTEPAWVGEGGVIPLTSFSLGSTTISRYKLASIVPLTMELAEMSTPAAEQVFRSAMQESYVRMLDLALISSGAAVAGVRPAGLLVGASTAAGDATGGYESVVADIKAMLGVFAAAGSGERPVLILNDQDWLNVGLLLNPLGQLMFQGDVAAGQLLGLPVLHSRTVTKGTAIMVDAANFVSAFDAPMFRVSQEATLTMADADDTAPTQATDTSGDLGTEGQVGVDAGIHVSGNTAGTGVTGYQARSMFQTYSEAIRGIWPTSWALVRSNSVVTRTSIAW